MNCKCMYWVRSESPFITEHHPNCEHFNPTEELKRLEEIINQMKKDSLPKQQIATLVCQPIGYSEDTFQF